MSFTIRFFFNDTATTEIYTLSLHDALPIYPDRLSKAYNYSIFAFIGVPFAKMLRSEEHTSELQSHLNLVCRLLLEKKNTSSRSPHSGQSFFLGTLSRGITNCPSSPAAP